VIRRPTPPLTPLPTSPTVEQLHDRLDSLRQQLFEMYDAVRIERKRADEAEQALGELRAAYAGGPMAEITRMRLTLLDYEDRLAACRDQHDGNTHTAGWSR
jgi:uncharacterized coiled-coil DUF342 family protein